MDIALLSLYLKNLPDSLPVSTPDSNINQLLHFSLDEEWVEEIGEEHTVNRSLEVALKNFGPRNDEGVFRITERGPGLEALPGVLQHWLGKYPNALLLQRWLQDSIASAKACFILHGKSVSSFLYTRKLCGLTAGLIIAPDTRRDRFNGQRYNAGGWSNSANRIFTQRTTIKEEDSRHSQERQIKGQAKGFGEWEETRY